MTVHEKAPAYQWYIRDWRSSRKVQKMSFKERGMYREMLDEQWERLTLPGDAASMAALLGGTVKEWIKSWAVLVENFLILADGRLQNQRLEQEREKQRAWRKQSSNGGKTTAARQAPAASTVDAPSASTGAHPTVAPTVAPAATTNSPPAASTLHLPLHLQSADRSLQLAGTSVPPPPPTARSKRPIFVGQRLTVFEWMLDELLKLLDPHGETFGLDEWFDTLDKRCLARGEIPPDRDNGAWLKSVTLTEAQQRGLPLRLAATATLGKTTSRLLAAVQNITREGGV